MKMKKCPGSGTVLMLAFRPDDKGYPGAAICIECSGGILVRKGTVHDAVSIVGFEGQAGTLRTHYTNRDKSRISYRKGT